MLGRRLTSRPDGVEGWSEVSGRTWDPRYHTWQWYDQLGWVAPPSVVLPSLLKPEVSQTRSSARERSKKGKNRDRKVGVRTRDLQVVRQTSNQKTKRGGGLEQGFRAHVGPTLPHGLAVVRPKTRTGRTRKSCAQGSITIKMQALNMRMQAMSVMTVMVWASLQVVSDVRPVAQYAALCPLPGKHPTAHRCRWLFCMYTRKVGAWRGTWDPLHPSAIWAAKLFPSSLDSL